MATFDFDLGILGGGAAGLTAASGAAQFGAKVLLVEKAAKLGGDCLHYGCVPSKTLIRTAAVWKLAARAEEFGLPGLRLPAVDLDRVMGRVRAVIEKIQEHDSPERFCGLGVKVLFGTPRFLDEHTVETEWGRFTAKSWVIATGSSPSLPPVEGLSDVPYWTSETVFSQKTLPNRFLVLGGGPIGLELAQAFQRLGSKVSLVEYADQLLPQEDADVAALVARRLQEEGMDIRTGTMAVGVEYSASTFRLKIKPVTGGGEIEILEGDALLVAAGRKPNTEGLDLSAAGVVHTPRGITTDLRLRTSQRHIYACGDVNGLLPFTHVAGYEGGIALSNAILRLPRKADYSRIPWCTYTDPEVASIGLNEKRARASGVEYRVITESFAENDRALTEGEGQGVLKLLLAPGGAILGCQIAGPHAGELIHEWVAALGGGVKLSTLAGAVHAYPTLSEISKKAAGTYFSEKLFSDTTKKVLKLLFSLKGRACTPDRTGGTAGD